MIDWLTENLGYSLTMKEYIGWFRLPYGFEFLKQPGLPWRTSVKRVFVIISDRLSFQRPRIQILSL
jgi:hypothetical protein